MNQKEILRAIREEIKSFTDMVLLPEDNREFLESNTCELGLDSHDIVELISRLDKKFYISHRIIPIENIRCQKIRDIFDIFVFETYSGEGVAMNEIMSNYCGNLDECVAFTKGWQEAIKWYKENQI